MEANSLMCIFEGVLPDQTVMIYERITIKHFGEEDYFKFSDKFKFYSKEYIMQNIMN